MTLYQRLKQEFEERKPVPSIIGYDTSLYKGNPELERIYESGYWDGLDSETGRNYPGDSATDEKRKAYMHGLFTGSEELLNDIGE